MKKTVLYSLLTLALAALLSACISQAEREFRSMSAVSQMEDVKNIHWMESTDKSQQGLIAVFGEKPAGFFYVVNEKSPKCGHYDQEYMSFPLFNMLSPVIYLPGLKGWNFEKVGEKENTFRLTRRKENDRLDTIVEIAFDPAGRLLSCQISENGFAQEKIGTLKVTEWVKINGKEFPARAESAFANGREISWQYTGWQFNLPADRVQKLIEDKQKLLNNKPVKERSNP